MSANIIVIDPTKSIRAASETSNRRKRGKSKKKNDNSNSKRIECVVCKIKVSSPQLLQHHCEGRKHRKKLNKLTKANRLSAPITEIEVKPSPEGFEPNNKDPSSAATKEMFSDKNPRRKTRQWHKKHSAHYPDAHHPDHYHQDYPQNYSYYQNNLNWNEPHWTGNGAYPPYQRDFGFDSRFQGFGPNSHTPNRHQVYEDQEHGRSSNRHHVYNDQGGHCTHPKYNEQGESSKNHWRYKEQEESSNHHMYNDQKESSNHHQKYYEQGESSNRHWVYNEQGELSNHCQECETSNGEAGVAKDLPVRDQQLKPHDTKVPKPEECVPKTQVKKGSRNSEAKKTTSKKPSPVRRPSDGEKRPILTENVTGRIAHWINPSNPKDQAEVMKLVTEFSKSKKKENLLKLKLQTDGENNCDQRADPATLSPDDDHSTVIITDDLWSSNSVSRRQKRSKSETLQQTGNINPFISDEGSASSSSAPRSSRKSKSHAAADPPSKKMRRKSSPATSEENSHLSENAQVLIEVAAEKRRKEQKSDNTKGHKCSTSKCLESCEKETIAESENITNAEVTESVSSAALLPSVDSSVVAPSLGINNPVMPLIPQVPVKQEIMDFEGSNNALHPCILEAFTLQEEAHKLMDGQSENPNATMTPVESLIDLFASGSIKVKKEFDDPVIDVIRTVDPEILNRVCEGQSSHTLQGTTEEVCSVHQNEAAVAKSPHPQLPPAACDTASVGDATDTEEAPDNLPFLKTSFKNILNEIQSISALEEKVKENLALADSKIQEYQSLLDEWKTKKIKVQSEEENLRKQRNNLVRTMADLVTQYNDEQSSAKLNDSTSNSRVATPDFQVQGVEADIRAVTSTAIQNKSLTYPEVFENISPQPQQNKKPVAVSKNTRSSNAQDTDDIAILPPPVQANNNVPLIDLEDSDEETTNISVNGLSSADTIPEIFSEDKITAHKATVNCIQFYEDYIYTCSNDFTAKRFSLKNTSPVVTYLHQKRNVSQLCIEKVRGLVIVFTICSGSKTIKSFKAVDGVQLKEYFMDYSVASICKSKGLIYAGLRNGSIVVCNWKDHRDLVNISEPIRSIDTTQQGRLNILVTLSVSGNVSIRDADRNGLLIRYVKARSYVPLFMTVYGNAVYLSSAGVLTVLDIETGTYMTKYSFSAAYTCLAVYRDSIFTASFSGLVRCYSKDEEKSVKMYYGAGGTAITCIYVHHGWVFTGNRDGKISAFKYDPNTVYSCKMEKCDFLFPRLKDLAIHVLGKDHNLPTPGSMCPWRKCTFFFPSHWETEVIKSHVRSHVQ